MLPIEEFRNKLKELMQKKIELAPGASAATGSMMLAEEDPATEDPDAAALDQLDQETPAEGGDTPPVDDNETPPEGDTGEAPPEEPAPEEPAPEAPPETPAPQNNQNDSQKIQEMFKDTGNPEVDYSLSNENNVRLFKFKFTYSGIDVDGLMTSDEEKKAGLSRKELEARLSPEQVHYYNDKWTKLREKFPQIAVREKNVAIHNANIMLLVNDREGEEIPLPEDKRMEAYKKINAMMDKKFGEGWQDLPEALNFLKGIKINFSNKNPVRTNLLSVKVLQEKDAINGGALIPFNKIYVEVPSSVQEFIRINFDSNIYNGSSIFQALSSDFKEADRTVGTMDAIIKGKPTEADAEGESDGGDSGGDSGGGGGGGMGGDLGGDMGGDAGGMPDLGAEDATGGDSGEDTSKDAESETGGDTGDTNTDSVL